MSIQEALQANWGRAVFAALWAGALSACWDTIRSTSPLRLLTDHAARLNWVLALLYTMAVYLAAVIGLLLIGLAVYLAVIRRFGAKHLLRGLLAIVFTLFVAVGIESFLRVQHVSIVAEYILRWLPMFAALFVACRFAVPTERGAFFRAAGKA